MGESNWKQNCQKEQKSRFSLETQRKRSRLTGNSKPYCSNLSLKASVVSASLLKNCFVKCEAVNDRATAG